MFEKTKINEKSKKSVKTGIHPASQSVSCPQNETDKFEAICHKNFPSRDSRAKTFDFKARLRRRFGPMKTLTTWPNEKRYRHFDAFKTDFTL